MLRGIILVVFAVLGFIIAGSLAAWLDEKRHGRLARLFMLLSVLSGGYVAWKVLGVVLGFLGPATSRLVLVVLVLVVLAVVGVVYLRIDAQRRAARRAPRRLE